MVAYVVEQVEAVWLIAGEPLVDGLDEPLCGWGRTASCG